MHVREWTTKDVPTAAIPPIPILSGADLTRVHKRNERGYKMRCYWEEVGILCPIYGLISKDLSEREIARKLNLPETTVNACTSWLMHFLKCDNRAELVLYAAPTKHETWGLHSLYFAA
jgi:hypothetical protein